MIKKILVPLDGTTVAAKILPCVEDLAKSLHAHITLLTVVDNSEKVHLADADTSIFEAISEAFHRAAKRNLVRTAYFLKAKGLEVNWVCQEGFPEEVIIQYAAENSCDLIAMATHTHSKISRMFVSVAEKVLTHATVPVLLTRIA
jgi:nucleotide-binding universal stress UspA family protein